ncbi:MAG: hypothetical protein KDA86_01830 [Planctomycetaceae bacterium]|nr:hypothetical protein [Planctomycetaceae bacterium]
MSEYSKYQKKVISRFYENRDQIDEQRLSELVTNLFLATTDKQRAKHWETAEGVMSRLGVPTARVEHVINSKDPTVLAAVVDEIQKGVLKLQKPKKPEQTSDKK